MLGKCLQFISQNANFLIDKKTCIGQYRKAYKTKEKNSQRYKESPNGNTKVKKWKEKSRVVKKGKEYSRISFHEKGKKKIIFSCCVGKVQKQIET